MLDFINNLAIVSRKTNNYLFNLLVLNYCFIISINHKTKSLNAFIIIIHKFLLINYSYSSVNL